MARPVKVQLSLVIDEELQPNQTHYDLAVAVEQKWAAQGLTVDNVKIDDGPARFSLRTPINQDPPNNQPASQPPAGEGGNTTIPYPTFSFRTVPRSASNPETSAALSTMATGDDVVVRRPAGTITFGHTTPFAAKLHMSRKERAKRFERLGLPVPPNARAKRRHRAEAAQDGSRDRPFRHDFESAGFNKRLRSKILSTPFPQKPLKLTIGYSTEQGLSAAAGPSNVSRMRKAMSRRAERSDAKRWSSYGNPDEDKKVDLLAQGQYLLHQRPSLDKY